MYTTPDAWDRPKRTKDKRHFDWSIKQRKQHFEDTVFSLLDRIHWESKVITFDGCPPLMAQESGWAGRTVTDFLAWVEKSSKRSGENKDRVEKKTKNARYIHQELKSFLAWGDAVFKTSKDPWVPPMPEFADFLKTKPSSKTRQLKRTKSAGSEAKKH